MTQLSISRSVLETSTREFKDHFREYLQTLAKDVDTDRVELISALEWCFDRWEHWRQKFYPDADLKFPFFQSGRRGSEFGHYSTCGSSGQPSVIHIKRSFLMGTSDITVATISSTKKLVLKADHPDRLRFVDQTILHELVHQFLHEASPNAAEYESRESGRSKYKGHGPLFAAECNRINRVLHPELGFEFVPVRHTKRSHAKVNDTQRPSCAHFTHGELLFAWDYTNPDLTRDQIIENRRRLEQALAFYNGAVELVEEAVEVETDFPAPFASDCADVCIQQLRAHDKANGTTLEREFYKAVLTSLQSDQLLDAALAGIGHSTTQLNIPPAGGENGNRAPSSEPTVPASADSHLSLIHPEDEGTVLNLTQDYPLSEPELSLHRLNSDIRLSGMKKAHFAAHTFGHNNGQQLSRHLKKLRSAVGELVAA